jgi:hypothetical protein
VVDRPHSDTQKLTRELARHVEDAVHDVAALAATRICEQVPSYRNNADPGLREDVAAHCRDVFDTFARSLAQDQFPSRDDFRVTGNHALRRVTQSIPLADFLQAFRISQLTLWESVLEIAQQHPDLQVAATDSVRFIMGVIEGGSTIAAEGYLEAQQFLLADAARAARDLVDDLLAGKTPTVGSRQATLRTAGLDLGSTVVVASGLATGDGGSRQVIVRALGVAGADHARTRGLIAFRHGEFIGIFPADDGNGEAVLHSLTRAFETLRAQGIELTIGISTVHLGLGGVPQAYCEAVTAREALSDRPGVKPLGDLTTFEYLITKGDQTARRLIDPAVRRFVEDDFAADRVYIDTLEAYAKANLNAKAAAETLFVHGNTAYYRLDRIAERTGKDLRRFDDVLDLLVAVKLLTPHARRNPRPPPGREA